MLTSFPEPTAVMVTLKTAVADRGKAIDHSFGCFKMLGDPDVRLVPHQVLHVTRLDDDWYRVTVINTETGDLSTWQCGTTTPVWILWKKERS